MCLIIITLIIMSYIQYGSPYDIKYPHSAWVILGTSLASLSIIFTIMTQNNFKCGYPSQSSFNNDDFDDIEDVNEQ